MAETTLAQTPRGRGQAQQKPNKAKALSVEAECEEKPSAAEGKGSSACEKPGQQKQTRQNAHMAQPRTPDLQLRSTSYNMQCQFHKDIKLYPTMENIIHP